MSDIENTNDAGRKDTEDLEAKLTRGLLLFYLANIIGLISGLKGIKMFGNLEGIVLMLLTIFGLYSLLGWAVVEWTEKNLSG